VFVREGSIRCGGAELGRRDGMGLWSVGSINIEVLQDDTDVMIVETIMIDDANIKTWESEHAGH
jgi:quercetin 2,3-dioxygenase